MLQPVRRGMPTLLGDRPADLAIQLGQQAQHQRCRVPSWLASGEPPTDPVQHLTEAAPPFGGVYAVRRGHRGVFVVRHKHLDDRPVAALTSANTPKITTS